MAENDPNDPIEQARAAAESAAEIKPIATPDSAAFKDVIKYIADYQRRVKDVNNDLIENARLQKGILQSEKTRSELQFEQFQLEGKRLEILQEMQDEIQSIKEKGELITGEDEERLKKLTVQSDALQKQLNLQGKSLEEARKFNKELQSQKSLQIEFGKMYATQMSSLTGITGHAKTLSGKMVEVAIKGKGLSQGLAAAGEEMKKMISGGNLAINIIDKAAEGFEKLAMKSIKSSLEMDKAFANFEKQVGNLDLYKSSMVAATLTNMQHGVSLNDTSQAYITLKNKIADFELMNESSRNSVANTAIQLDKLGISLETTGEITKYLVKSLKLSGEQASTFNKQLAMTAKSMGLIPGKVLKEYAGSLPRLSAYGKDTEKVFLNLQKASRDTGIEMDKLTKVAEKFDTFEGAAEAAGKLNAMLGGDLFNAVEMTLMQDDEKIEYMRERLKLSGIEFASITREQKQLLARESGLNSVAELEALLNNETERGSIALIEKQAAQEDLNKSLKNATALADSFRAVMDQLFISLDPLVVFLKDQVIPRLSDMVKWFREVTESSPTAMFIAASLGLAGLAAAFIGPLVMAAKFAKGTKDLAADLIEAAKGVKDLAGAVPSAAEELKGAAEEVSGATENIKDLAENMKNTGKEAADVGGKTKDLSSGINQTSEAAKSGWKEMLAFGGAILLAGVGIAAAALGLAQLVSAFKDLTGDQLTAAITTVGIVFLGFIAIIGILATASLTAVGPMYALGGAVALIGLGIGIAAFGMSLLVQSFAGLGENAAPAAGAVIGLAAAIALITIALALAAPAIMGVAAAGTIGAAGLLAIGGAMALVGIAIAAVALSMGYFVNAMANLFKELNSSKPETIKQAFVSLFEGIKSGGITGIAAFAKFASAAEDLNDAMEDLAESLSNVVDQWRSLSSLDSSFFKDIMSGQSFSLLASSLNQIVQTLSNPISTGLIDTLREMAEIIDDMSTFKLTAIAKITTSVEPAKTAAVSPAAMSGMNIVPSSVVASTTNNTNTTNLVKNNSMSNVNNSAAQTPNKIAIYLDGRLLGEVTDQRISDYNKKLFGTG